MNSNLTPKNRRFLKSKAHHLKPLSYVGKAGVTTEFLGQVSQTLRDHELVKVKFNDFKEERKELCEEIASKAKAAFVGMTGNTAIFFKPRPKVSERKYTLPE